MKKLITWFVLVFVAVVITSLVFPTWTPRINSKNSISILKQIPLNGSKQEIMIRGNDKSNPVIIFVHGGPGCPEIPFATKYDDLLEKNFTVVHYDQRGSGKSYHFLEDYSNLSSQILVEDLLELTDYISKTLNQKKVILVGHSFGTYIAMQAVQKSPEKYIAYIGIGQVSDMVESETNILNFCLHQANVADNKKDIDELKNIEKYIRNGVTPVPRSFVHKYGGTSRLVDDSKFYSDDLWVNHEYNLLDVMRLNLGISASQKPLVTEIMKNPLPSLVKSIEIPCYFVMGKYDYMTSVSAAQNYFNSFGAPKKEFVLFTESAHYPQFEEKEKFAEWFFKNFSNN